MANVNYRIFQLRDTRETEYGFMRWSYAKNKFDFNDYYEVYSGEIEKRNCLEALFEKFNLHHPEDFKGHSLSVSDVVAIKDEGKDYWYWYYCDSFGWEEITEIVNHSKAKKEGKNMVGRITRDSWRLIAKRIIEIVEDDHDFGNDDFAINDLKEYLTDEGIIEVIEN